MRTLFFLLPSLLSLASTAFAQNDEGRISEFGRYEGWSKELYDEWVTTSQYVEMHDGVRLAVDVTRPAKNGIAVDKPYPLVWTHSRYHRNPASFMGNPRIRSDVDVNPALQRLVRHGYVVAGVGVRGSGASFGRFEGLFSEAETQDAAEMIAWFAKQPWCNGNVGMYGGSYLGITQYMAASKSPSALKAIFPEVAGFDIYDVIYPGGVFRQDMMRHWAKLTTWLDRNQTAPPVDGDTDKILLKAAVAEHADNWDVMAGYSSAPFRDHASEIHDWSTHGPAAHIDAINASGVAMYHYNGWYDIFALDTTLWFANYKGTQRMTMGDWSHATMTQERRKILEVEQHRWFDRWLKDIHNGIEKEAPIRYALMIDPGESRWMEAKNWPVATKAKRFFFAKGSTNKTESLNDGLLTHEASEATAQDVYKVDPATTSGSSSRWDNAVGAGAMRYGSLAENDARCLTYTTPPLKEDLTVVGHPIVRLFLSSSSGDADLHVLLEEIGTDGTVRYITEAVLRASQRALTEAPYDNLDLPYQRCFSTDGVPLSKEQPNEILMDLHPTAVVFNKGHRLRVTIMGADADNTAPSPFVNDTTLRVFLGGETASFITLPVLP